MECYIGIGMILSMIYLFFKLLVYFHALHDWKEYGAYRECKQCSKREWVSHL